MPKGSNCFRIDSFVEASSALYTIVCAPLVLVVRADVITGRVIGTFEILSENCLNNFSIFDEYDAS